MFKHLVIPARLKKYPTTQQTTVRNSWQADDSMGD